MSLCKQCVNQGFRFCQKAYLTKEVSNLNTQLIIACIPALSGMASGVASGNIFFPFMGCYLSYMMIDMLEDRGKEINKRMEKYNECNDEKKTNCKD